MSNINLSTITDRLWAFWDKLLKRVDDEGTEEYSREKIVVFIISLILALCLWFLVNLSRAYVLNVNLPIELGNIPDDRALAEDLPDFATVSVQGEGWKLLNLYNNPPQIFVDVTSGEVNLYDQVQQQMNAIPDIDVQKVQPLVLSLNLEEKASKKVPVRPRVSVQFERQYDFIEQPRLSPDSITISGASSIVNEIEAWETDSVHLEGIRSDISRPISLKKPSKLLSISADAVQYSAGVAQYTEGETRVFVRASNLPAGQNITFSPAYITVRYTVPIEEYSEVQDRNPITAIVPYSTLRADSTGFVTPRIEVPTDQYHIEIESHKPKEVSYFEVVSG
ncbi:YbbR-like domain-containing protein [Halalkalibaculum sp. DA3122]|uniref:CdaR family protein n=1 Tax=unclassified Halalkalibaculum TaxID=2964617 RepID=UPI0037550B77